MLYKMDQQTIALLSCNRCRDSYYHIMRKAEGVNNTTIRIVDAYNDLKTSKTRANFPDKSDSVKKKKFRLASLSTSPERRGKADERSLTDQLIFVLNPSTSDEDTDAEIDQKNKEIKPEKKLSRITASKKSPETKTGSTEY